MAAIHRTRSKDLTRLMVTRTGTLCLGLICLCCAAPAIAGDMSDPPPTPFIFSAHPLLMAQDTPAAGDSTDPADSERLPPLRFSLADWFSPDYHGLPNTRSNTVVFRAYVPWSIFSVEQLSRLSIPIVTSSPGKSTDATDGDISETPAGPSGLSNIEFYDVSLVKTDAGVLSIGPVISFPTGTVSGVGNGKWTLGPALGFADRQDDWRLGFFSQGYFSFAGDPDKPSVDRMKVQPIIDYSLPDGWGVGCSEMNFTYDFIKGRFTNLPLGIQVGRNFEAFSQSIRLSGQAEYNFANTGGTSEWTFRFTLDYFVPW
jgi:hypothetical protein